MILGISDGISISGYLGVPLENLSPHLGLKKLLRGVLIDLGGKKQPWLLGGSSPGIVGPFKDSHGVIWANRESGLRLGGVRGS